MIASVADAAAPALTVADLTVDGDSGERILAVDRFSVPGGACVGIRGASGAGKSTFLFALAGLIPSASGAVRWGADDILRLSESRRARFRRTRLGLVFQDFLLFEELTASANASLAAAYAPAAERRSIEAGARAMLGRLDVPASNGRSSATYSGGERQRIAMARALAHDPAIILADEPTASLDRATGDRLIDDLVSLARGGGKTLIAVSHDPAFLGRMDWSVTMIDGQIVPEPGHA